MRFWGNDHRGHREHRGKYIIEINLSPLKGMPTEKQILDLLQHIALSPSVLSVSSVVINERLKCHAG
jgi:hypothetical protein